MNAFNESFSFGDEAELKKHRWAYPGNPNEESALKKLHLKWTSFIEGTSVKNGLKPREKFMFMVE